MTVYFYFYCNDQHYTISICAESSSDVHQYITKVDNLAKDLDRKRFAMSYKTQEFKSPGLSPQYPAYYKEFQIVNWTSEDIVITDSNGNQTVREGSCHPVSENALCVVIECRTGNGMRINNSAKTTYGEAPSVQLNAQRITVPYADIKQAPVKVEEFNVILSTVEQAIIARDMMCEYNYGPLLVETRVDTQLTDPRFVFQVIDPNNQWDALLLNVFGQTVVLRSGRFNRLTCSGAQNAAIPEQGRLICYLRYPTDMYDGCQTRQVVFDISLEELYKKEPFRLQSGDLICVATCMEDLQEVMAKKAAHSRGIGNAETLTDKMVPKEVYDSAESAHKDEVERLKQVHQQKIETITTAKNTEIATLKSKLADTEIERDALKKQVQQWEKLSEANTTFAENKEKVELEREKARREAAEAARKDIDNMWTTLKIGGTIAASVLSFALTVLLKTKK